MANTVRNTGSEDFLRDYQKQAVKNLATGKILCGGVGSGKSRTALAYYAWRFGKVDVMGHRLSFPSGYSPIPLYIITTAKKRDSKEWDLECAPFRLSNVTIDSWNNIKKYVTVKNAFFIFDEQRVVGWGAWSKSFVKIAWQNDWILLSATPGDKWEDYIPVFVANRFYRNKTEFTQAHCVYSRFTKYPSIERYLETGRLIRLRNRILVDMDFKRETVQHHNYLMLEYNMELYRTVVKFRMNPYTEVPIKNAAEFCQMLRQIVNSSPNRLEKALELFRKHKRVIIFYNYDYELSLLKQLFEGVTEVAEWNGHKHQEVPVSNSWVYLVQYNAGAEGWNCITTDTIIFYSQNYSYRMMEQAAGRIDRLNTTYKDLYYYHFTSRSTIDIAINRALSRKKKFNESAFANFS